MEKRLIWIYLVIKHMDFFVKSPFEKGQSSTVIGKYIFWKINMEKRYGNSTFLKDF